MILEPNLYTVLRKIVQFYKEINYSLSFSVDNLIYLENDET